MTTLTRDTIRDIRADIDAALRAVAAKHGMAFSLGTIRFDPYAGTMRGTLQGNKVTFVPGTQAAVRTANPLVGAALKAHGIDETKTYYNAKLGEFTITDFVARRHKYPVTIRTASGKNLKVTIGYIKASPTVA